MAPLSEDVWKESATKHQNEIRESLFGNRPYDFFELTDYGKGLLRKKISFAMFGPPTNAKLTLSENEEKTLTKIFNLLCEENKGQTSFRISFVYVKCLVKGKSSYFSVIRLHLTVKTKKTTTEKSVFIDDKPRAYVDFNDYLNNNKLPQCLMCYPANGSYYLQEREGSTFKVLFKKSPASKTFNKILKSGDSASSKLMLAGIIAAAAFPATMPIMAIGTWVVGGSATLYKVGRSVGTLVDRGLHGQTLSIRSSEVQNCWLSIGSAAACVASADVLFSVVKTDQTAVRESLPTSGLGVVNDVTVIVRKLLKGESIAPIDLVFLESACLMFANVMITTFKVKAILGEMSKNKIGPDNFLKELAISVRVRPEFGKLANTSQVVNLATLGMFYTLPIPTVDLSSCLKANCKRLSESAKEFGKKSTLTTGKFADIIASHLFEVWSAFGNEMQSMVEWFCKLKGKKALCEVFGDITLNNAQASIYQLVAMLSWFRNQGADKDALYRLASVIKLQEDTGKVRAEDGAEKWMGNFSRTCDFLKKELNWQKTFYQKGFEAAKANLPKITESEYQDLVEITGPVSEYFWERAVIQMTKYISSTARQPNPAKENLKTPSGSDQQQRDDQYFTITREKLLTTEFERLKKIYQKGFEAAKMFAPIYRQQELKGGQNRYPTVGEISGPIKEYFCSKALVQASKELSKTSHSSLAKGNFVATPGSSCLVDVETGTTVHFFHGVTPGGSDQQLNDDQYFSVVREKLGHVLDNGASLEVDLGSSLGFFRDVPNNSEGITCVIVKCVPEEGYVAGHIFVVRK